MTDLPFDDSAPQLAPIVPDDGQSDGTSVDAMVVGVAADDLAAASAVAGRYLMENASGGGRTGALAATANGQPPTGSTGSAGTATAGAALLSIGGISDGGSASIVSGSEESADLGNGAMAPARRFAAGGLGNASTASVVDGPFIQLGPAPSTGLTNVVQSADNPPSGSVTGAVQAIVVNPGNSSTIWIATPNGGIWVTHNGGASWTPLTDKQASLSIASLTLDPTDTTTNTLIAGIGTTSNGAIGQNFTRGGQETGLLYSTNGGTTWTSLGSGTLAGQSVDGVAARGQVILAATFNQENPASTVGGLYRSTNGGAVFSQITFIGGLVTPVTSLVGDPTNTSKLYAAITSPSASTFASTGVYVSSDTGATWTQIFGAAQSGGVISGSNQTIARVAADGAEIAVGVVNVSTGVLAGLYLSTNSGSTWTSLSVPAINPGGQAVNNFAIALDPTAAGVVYVTGDRLVNSPFTVQAWRVTTAGATSITDANTGNNSSVHADSRAIAFDATGRLLLGTDGGIYVRNSPTTSTGDWTSLIGTNLSLKETYNLAFDGNSDRLLIAGQDTGVGFENTPGGQAFTAVNGGDGVNAALNDQIAGSSNSALYDSSQSFGLLSRLIVDPNGNVLGNASVAFSAALGTVQFSAPFVVNKIDPSRIVVGTASVFVTQDTTLSNTTETTDTLNVTNIGGVGGAVLNVSYGTQDNTQAVLAAGDGSAGGAFLWLSTATTPAAGTLTAVTAYAGAAPVSVTFDLRTEQRFYVADQTNLFGTQNEGAAFSTLTANLTALNIINPTSLDFISNNGVNALLVGGLDSVANAPSPIAVADSDASGNLTNWRAFGSGLPNTYVTALNYDSKSDTLAVGLFGRGGWVMYDVTSNFSTASVLQFGLANNNSNPDVSLLTGARPLAKFGTGTLTITGTAAYTGGSTINGGIIQVGSGAVAGNISGTGTITFNTPQGALGLSNDAGFSNTLSGFTVGAVGTITDFVDIEGHTVTVSSATGQGTTNATINLSDGVVLHLTNLSSTNWSPETASDGTTGTDVFVATCYCRGTLILTDRGEVPVEELAIGDKVATLSGAFKSIVWIGFGRDLVTRTNKLARPIIVRRGALADNVPYRDLYLTHGHALYLDEVLIPVENLINYRSILWDESTRIVEYYHIELVDHDVLLANGAPAETYYDAGNRALFQNLRVGSQPGAATPGFAPVLSGGEVVDRVWASLYERAGGRIEHDTTDETDLHLVVDGERLDAVTVEAGAYIFAVAAPPARTLHLCSRSGVPSLLGITRHDHRRLGVAVSRLELRQSGIATVFAHEAPLFVEGGCHPAENGYCWTDGELDLPRRLFAHLTDAFTLTVHTERPGMRYPIPILMSDAA